MLEALVGVSAFAWTALLDAYRREHQELVVQDRKLREAASRLESIGGPTPPVGMGRSGL